MRRIIACGILALVVSACGTPGGTGGTSPVGGSATSLVQATVGSSATRTASSGGGSGLVDPAGLSALPQAKVCTLLSSDEAAAVLGMAIDGPATGMLVKGLGTNCVYTAVAGADGSAGLLKIEFGAMGYQSLVGLLKITGIPQSLTVAGRPAMGLDTPADPKAFVKAQLYVSLLDDPKSVALYVEAPTLAMAKKAAETVVPRIATLK